MTGNVIDFSNVPASVRLSDTLAQISLVSASAGLILQPVGAQGPQGVPGPAYLGFADYSDTDVSILTLAAGVRTQLTRLAPALAASSRPQPPFLGAAMWDGQKLRGRKLGDTMTLVLDLRVRPLLSGGTMAFDIDVAAPFGPIDSTRQAFANQTGTVQPMLFTAYIDCRSYYMANGGAIMLTSSVPCEISQASPRFIFIGASP